MITPKRELSFGFVLKTVVPSLYFCLVLDFFAGFFLGSNFEKIMENYPYILVALPGMMGLRGNVFGSMSSRLSTALYLGSSKPSFRDKYILKNLFASIWLATLPIIFLLLFSAFKLGFSESFHASFQIVVASSVLVSFILALASVSVVIIAFRKMIDPDSVSGPIVTSISDLVTIPILVTFLYITFPAVFWILLSFLLVSLYISFKNGYRRLYAEILAIVSFLAIIQALSGSILEEFSELVYLSFFVSFLYPSLIDNLGNYGTIIVARTSTKLHLGEIRGRFSELLFDLKVMLPTSFLIFPFIALPPIAMSLVVYGVAMVKPISMLIFFISYVFMVFFTILLAFYLTVFLRELRIDPDNGGIPLITTIADFYGTVYAIFLAYIIIAGI